MPKLITDIDTAITKRFFEALHTLIENNTLAGKKTFTDKYGIDRRNLTAVERNPYKQSVRLPWISYLICDFDISGEWIMTGRGKMFVKKINKYCPLLIFTIFVSS